MAGTPKERRVLDNGDAPAAAADRAPRSVGFLLSQLGYSASQRFLEALKPLGLHPREFLLLRFISAAEGRSQQALASLLAVPPSRMVALVDHLEELGLIERRPDPHDRRVRALHLTDRGRKVHQRAIAVAIEHEQSLCSGLSESEREQLIDLLHKLQPELIELRGVHPGLS